MSVDPETIAALATPSGESAIALIRLSGAQARNISASILGLELQPRVATHGAYRGLSGEILDDIIATFFAAPNSYTGEDVLELSGHGNPVIVRLLLEDLYRRGCRPAEPGEFTRRAFLNGRMDLSQAEAVADLIRARSDRAIDAANRQLRGSLGRQIADLSESLVSAVARTEAYIDFPEEDLPPEDRSALRASIDAVLIPLAALLATSRYGELLRAGVRTVIVGRTNAGKSSLLNRMLGRNRAIVSSTPGTTRDFLEEPRILGGHCLRLIDTAGLNPVAEGIEEMGIARSRELVASADLVLLVVDSTLPFPDIESEISERLSPQNTILVWNKSDLAAAGDSPPQFADFRGVSICATDGSGIAALETEIIALVESYRKDPGPELVAINARHAHDLQEARGALERALDKVNSSEPDEFLAADLRVALDCLGRIGGKIDNEQVLDKLFAEFCIGK